MTQVVRDWHEWHRLYDDPTSSLSRRLAEVSRHVRTLLVHSDNDTAPTIVTSMCAGDGRDLLPFLGTGCRALLVELDPALAASARSAALAAGLDVEVRTQDAGTTDAYADHPPADLLLACGVFGNIEDADVATTVATLPCLLAAGAHVVWTRGHRVPDDPTLDVDDPAEAVRVLFASSGFEEVAFVRPTDAPFRVGVHRLMGEPTPYVAGVRMFDFV